MINTKEVILSIVQVLQGQSEASACHSLSAHAVEVVVCVRCLLQLGFSWYARAKASFRVQLAVLIWSMSWVGRDR